MTTAVTTPTVDHYLAELDVAARERATREPESIGLLRRRAGERFAELGFPTTRLEEWRATNVGPIARTTFRLAGPAVEVTPADLAPFLYPDTHLLVLVNGRFSPELSRLEGLADGVVAGSLATLLAQDGERIERHLARQARFDDHAFVALNTALFRDGAFLQVPRHTVVERPIHVLHVGRPEAEPTMSFPRNLIVADEGSELRVVEHYVTVGAGPYFVCPVTEVVTGPNAKIDHYKLQRESTEAYHVATLQVLQDRASLFSSHSLSWGGGLVRNDVNAVLDGEGCEAILNGLYMVEGTQLVDNHMRVEHVKPHCASHELYKGILEGRSRAVFNGRIYVHKGAQKTDAKQTNRNLLLSRDALCNSNPQLEIFADDVKCTHGSTVGQLDANALFYLRCRGIGEDAARSLLTYAFAADIVERIKVAPVRQDLEEFLFRRLPKGDIVRQAV